MTVVNYAYRPKGPSRKKREQPALAQTIVSPAPMKKTPRPVIREGGAKYDNHRADHPTIVTATRRRKSTFPEVEDFDAAEHRRRGELAKALWHDIVRAATGNDPS